MDMNHSVLESPYKGSGNLTREQFYYFEMRTTARLMCDGLDDKTIIQKIINDNLFQFPTERTIKKAASVCVNRLHALNDETLVEAIAFQDSVTAKQVCLYAMMQQYRLVRDFMITVIGTKYRQQDFTFTRRDLKVFFLQLQEQDDLVAGWSEATVKKIISVVSKVLIENDYIDDGKSQVLKPVLISSILENAIRATGQKMALPAFNCLN